MINWWVVISFYGAGFAFVAGNQCDTEDVNACYEDLVHYETLVFPLYGHNTAKLDDTCGNINMSLSCINSYIETCVGSEDCDENCQKLIKEIQVFARSTGLKTLSDSLCDTHSTFRHIYLENSECLENNADLYAECHNTSQKSQHYIHSTPGANSVEASCCYLSWYKDCFTNITRDNCGENATVIVSIGAHYLIGNVAEILCSNVTVFCDKPPLPADEIDYEIDNKSDSSATTLHVSTMLVLPYLFSILLKFAL